jgi:hypothetical protein
MTAIETFKFELYITVKILYKKISFTSDINLLLLIIEILHFSMSAPRLKISLC